MRERPTQRQVEVLKVIDAFVEEVGFPPTIRELGEMLDIKSTNGVNDHLKALKAHGLLSKDSFTARSLVLTAAGRDLARGAP